MSPHYRVKRRCSKLLRTSKWIDLMLWVADVVQPARDQTETGQVQILYVSWGMKAHRVGVSRCDPLLNCRQQLGMTHWGICSRRTFEWMSCLCSRTVDVLTSTSCSCTCTDSTFYALSWQAAIPSVELIHYGLALCNRADHYIFALWFLSSFFFLSFFPRLISAGIDWMSTVLPHMVWP